MKTILSITLFLCFIGINISNAQNKDLKGILNDITGIKDSADGLKNDVTGVVTNFVNELKQDKDSIKLKIDMVANQAITTQKEIVSISNRVADEALKTKDDFTKIAQSMAEIPTSFIVKAGSWLLFFVLLALALLSGFLYYSIRKIKSRLLNTHQMLIDSITVSVKSSMDELKQEISESNKQQITEVLKEINKLKS